MVNAKLLRGVAVASAMVLSSSASAITVETTNYISSPIYFNGFEGIGPYSNIPSYIYNGNNPYSEGGITVQYVGTFNNGGIWTNYTPSIGGQGSYGWFPNGGGLGYTKITLTNGGTFQNVQFLAGSGNFGSSLLQYELLNNGVLVASGTTPNTISMHYVGFSGGGFDEIFVQSIANGNRSSFNPIGDDALAIDSIAANPTPLPAALPLFATGLGVMGLLGWRRKRKDAAAALPTA